MNFHINIPYIWETIPQYIIVMPCDIKRKYSFLFLLIFAFLFANRSVGQDYIVSKNGDTIRCQITAINDSTINLSVPYLEKTRETFVYRSTIKAYYYNYSLYILNTVFADSSEIFSSPVTTQVSNKGTLYITVLGGYDFCKGNSKELKYGKLLTGYSYGIQAGFLFTGNVGLGARFNAFNNKTSGNYNVNSGRSNSDFHFDDNISLCYFAPEVTFQIVETPRQPGFFVQLSCGPIFFNNQRHQTEEGSAMGYMYSPGYSWEKTEDIEFKKWTYGIIIGGGMRFTVVRNFSIDFAVDYLYSPPLVMKGIPELQISRVELSAGLNYRVKLWH